MKKIECLPSMRVHFNEGKKMNFNNILYVEGHAQTTPKWTSGDDFFFFRTQYAEVKKTKL